MHSSHLYCSICASIVVWKRLHLGFHKLLPLPLEVQSGGRWYNDGIKMPCQQIFTIHSYVIYEVCRLYNHQRMYHPQTPMPPQLLYTYQIIMKHQTWGYLLGTQYTSTRPTRYTRQEFIHTLQETLCIIMTQETKLHKNKSTKYKPLIKYKILYNGANNDYVNHKKLYSTQTSTKKKRPSNNDPQIHIFKWKHHKNSHISPYFQAFTIINKPMTSFLISHLYMLAQQEDLHLVILKTHHPSQHVYISNTINWDIFLKDIKPMS